MQTVFSFNYGGNVISLSDEGVHRIDENLTVTAQRSEYAEYSAVHWILWFENTGSENTALISEIWDCDAVLPCRLPACPQLGFNFKPHMPGVTSFLGCTNKDYLADDPSSALEFAPQKAYFRPGSALKYKNDTSRSSDELMPFFHLTTGNGGAMIAIGWSGSWQAQFTAQEDGVRIRTGLGCDPAFYLKPGEKIRTTSILIMEYTAGEDCSNKFRRLLKNHFSHTACEKAPKEGLFAFELWGGLSSELMLHRIAEIRAHGIPYEELWLDAGWYGECLNSDSPFGAEWGRFTGEWSINPHSHPDRLLDVNQAANETGMHMMLWFEPERATRFVPKPQEHPDWFLIGADVDPLIRYANPEAYNYILETVSGYVEQLGMGCYRQDYNSLHLGRLAAQNDEEDRHGLNEIRQIMAVYQLWDDLHARFPQLLIDNCSSGGRRIDIESLSRAIPFFRSDYQCGFDTCPEVLQTHNSNISFLLPYSGCTTKIKADTYNIRSCYSSSFGVAYYNSIFQEMNEEDWAWAKKTAEEYLSIRKYFSQDFYNHGSAQFDMTSWAIWQYHNPETGKGIVMAFRRPESPFASAEITLGGICPEKQIAFRDLDSGETFTGNSSIILSLPEKRSSLILEYHI